MPCIYKPVRGERPLWDFPDGTLADRELAAYRVSRVAGWDCVPLTVLRDGPYGPGMVQRWIETPTRRGRRPGAGGRIPPGWLPVLRALDTDGDDVAVVHADAPALALLAGFDLVVNNADRKGSHVLPTADGRLLGVDHGLCFHADDKLRTILWGWAGQPLPDPVSDGIARLTSALADACPGADRPDDDHRSRRPGRPLAAQEDARVSRRRPPIARRSRGRRYDRLAGARRAAPAPSRPDTRKDAVTGPEERSLPATATAAIGGITRAASRALGSALLDLTSGIARIGEVARAVGSGQSIPPAVLRVRVVILRDETGTPAHERRRRSARACRG